MFCCVSGLKRTKISNFFPEPSNVELSVVLCYNPDKDLNVETPDKQWKSLLSSAHVIELTPAIKVELLPKAARH